MKSAERNLLDENTLRHNQEAIKKQLAKFSILKAIFPTKLFCKQLRLDEEFSFLSFFAISASNITVNYMMAKDSVKKRLSGEASEGMSFTEFLTS